ncbi:conjugal transfer protein TraO [Phocaeicola barnesiae]|uniref:conjugal transfer protein TraO n=1 Tax=Phocaeicola barnesiae TaxID=376804 RepID=UPI00242E1DE9|nr:conjugal transfer protein TraO [Phocaeicola barnesiae]
MVPQINNRGDKLLVNATLQDKDNFIYGSMITLELETHLTDQVVLLVNVKKRMLYGSDIGKFHTQVGM